jgi:hypothetical protein
MKTKEEIIYDMCMTYRHDYGLRKQPNDPPWTAGMTEEDAKSLYQVMEQIYDNDIAPLLQNAQDLYEGNSVVVPKDKEHAEAMVKMGMFYLEQKNAPKQSK